MNNPHKHHDVFLWRTSQMHFPLTHTTVSSFNAYPKWTSPHVSLTHSMCWLMTHPCSLLRTNHHLPMPALKSLWTKTHLWLQCCCCCFCFSFLVNFTDVKEQWPNIKHGGQLQSVFMEGFTLEDFMTAQIGMALRIIAVILEWINDQIY